MKKKILLVDDDAAIRFCFSKYLADQGYDVVECENPTEALALDVFQFQGVVTDNDMPKMKGVEFIAALRDRGYWLPVVMVSGTVDETVEVRVLALKAKFFDKLSAHKAIESLAA